MFSHFANSDDCREKVTLKSIRLQLVFIQKKIWSSWRNRFFSGEKMRNSDNFIYDFAHPFFGDDFKSNALRYNGHIFVHGKLFSVIQFSSFDFCYPWKKLVKILLSISFE